MQTLRVNNSRILTIKNAKLSGHHFYMNLNIWGDFQIYISVPLTQSFHLERRKSCISITQGTLGQRFHHQDKK